MLSQLEEIRDQQRQTWDKFAAGWNKWDELAELACPPWASNSSAVPPYGTFRTYLMSPPVPASRGSPRLLSYRKGLSLSPISVRECLRLLRKTPGIVARNLQTKQCDAGVLPFPDNSFDAVLCRFGLMFFPDVDVAVKEHTCGTAGRARVRRGLECTREEPLGYHDYGHNQQAR